MRSDGSAEAKAIGAANNVIDHTSRAQNEAATAGPVIENPGDLAAMLTALQEREDLFIDAVHRRSPTARNVPDPRARRVARSKLPPTGVAIHSRR